MESAAPYEFLTNFLPRFYATTNVIKMEGRSLLPQRELLGGGGCLALRRNDSLIDLDILAKF
jgi:hypothetical protein